MSSHYLAAEEEDAVQPPPPPPPAAAAEEESSSSPDIIVDATLDDLPVTRDHCRRDGHLPPPLPSLPLPISSAPPALAAAAASFEEGEVEAEQTSQSLVPGGIPVSERRPSIAILAAAEAAGELPEANVMATPSHDVAASAAAITVDPSTPSVNSAPGPVGLFRPTRPANTPVAAGSAHDIFSPTRPVQTPVASRHPPTVTPPRPPRPAVIPYSRRESLLAKSHLTFKSSLKHQFPLIDQQVAGGQQSVKRIATFLKKVCEASELHASGLLRLTQAEESRAEAHRHGEAMTDHHKAVSQMTAAVEALALRDQLFAQKILATVVKPLLAWLPAAEDRRAKVVKDEKSSSSALADKNREADKIRLAGVKLWTELLALRKEKDSCAADPAKAEKVAKKLAKVKTDARAAFAKFEATKDAVVKRNQEWRVVVLPSLLGCLEELERERLDLTKKVLSAFTVALRESVGPEPQPLAILSTVEQQVQLLNSVVDINRFIDGTIQAHGLPPPDPALVQDLPCASADLAPDTERWEAFVAPTTVTPSSPVHARGGSASASAAAVPSIAAGDSLAAMRDHRTFTGGDESKEAAASASAAAAAGDDEEEEDEEDETLGTALPQTIRETWVIAQVDHPLSSAAAFSSSSSSSSSPSDLPLLRFSADDIIRVTDKVSGGEGMWIGSNVGEINGPLGRFPRSIVRSVDDKFVEPPVDAATEAARSVADLLRAKVSKKKRRFVSDGFDLDLSYILPNVIAMGFPSEGLEGTYRNHMADVQRFFQKRHPDSYRIYNLCSERSYEPAKFDGRVLRAGFDDHNPCSFDMILPIMRDIHAHLYPNGVLDPARVAAIHCKAGKGRTGFIICCWLLYSGLFPSYMPELPLRFYAIKRTKNQKGVTIPSQIRYVMLFARWLRMERGLSRFPVIPPHNPVLLQSIRLVGIPASVSKGRDIWFKLSTADSKYSSKGRITPVRRLAEDDLIFQGQGSISSVGIAALDQDVLVQFYTGSTFSSDSKLLAFWLNTRFLGLMDGNESSEPLPDDSDDGEGRRTLVLTKAELDKATKDIRNVEFIDTFRVELVFTSS